jgi:hypothetical protein
LDIDRLTPYTKWLWRRIAKRVIGKSHSLDEPNQRLVAGHIVIPFELIDI